MLIDVYWASYISRPFLLYRSTSLHMTWRAPGPVQFHGKRHQYHLTFSFTAYQLPVVQLANLDAGGWQAPTRTRCRSRCSTRASRQMRYGNLGCLMRLTL
jgi:hypothetical protein